MRAISPVAWAMLALTLTLAGCVDHTRGAVVQMNIGRDALARSAITDGDTPGTHYALYAFLGGGPVPVARFKVFDNIADCGLNPAINSTVRLVQRFESATEDVLTTCTPDHRLGALDTLDLAAGQLIGGIRIATGIDLEAAERLIITLEDDVIDRPIADRDPPPGVPVLVADVALGVAPYDEDCADEAPTPRRGVLRGIFVRASDTTPCGGRAGVIAIVPAVDETFF